MIMTRNTGNAVIIRPRVMNELDERFHDELTLALSSYLRKGALDMFRLQYITQTVARRFYRRLSDDGSYTADYDVVRVAAWSNVFGLWVRHRADGHNVLRVSIP